VLSVPSLLAVEKALARVHLYFGLMTLLFNLPSLGLPYPPYASVYPSVAQSALPSLQARLCTDQHFTLGAFLAARCSASLTAVPCLIGLLNTVLFSTHNRPMLGRRLGSP
jgi:hypothetical protein